MKTITIRHQNLSDLYQSVRAVLYMLRHCKETGEAIEDQDHFTVETK